MTTLENMKGNVKKILSSNFSLVFFITFNSHSVYLINPETEEQAQNLKFLQDSQKSVKDYNL